MARDRGTVRAAEDHRNLVLGLRIGQALLIVMTSLLAWIWVWLVPSIGEAITAAFSASYHRSPARVIGNIWQWVFLGSCLFLVGALVTGWRRLVRAAALWAGALLVLEGISTYHYGWQWTSLLVAALAAGLLVGVNWFAGHGATHPLD